MLNERTVNPLQKEETTKAKKPAHEIRIGAVKEVIWKNDTPQGERRNVSFVRLYKDGEQWNETTSFGRDDLLLLAKVADLAHTWIYEQA